ncbi:hypothetical protein K438DRAFT_1982808 [Mycena galopus ATCC 62051]|nr:hypothetical protein K438DRAFT_1982808 [Mycena galopus ATCC 62051]
MFHQSSYPSTFYGTPISRAQTQTNPREKYLAALANAQAAEAEYLAAEQLQQEEDQLRQRLEQIQSLRQHQQPGAYYAQPQTWSRHAAPLDFDALRRQIAAEERARIEEEREVLRVHELDEQRKRQELEVRRVQEARKAQQVARDVALAARRAELQDLTRPSMRVIVSEDAHRPCARNAVEHYGCEPKSRKVSFVSVRPVHKANDEPFTQENVEVEDIFNQLFGGRVEARRELKPNPKKATTAPQIFGLEDLFHLIGGNVASQPKADTKPAKAAAPQPQVEAPITLEQLLNHFLGAAGIASEQSKAPTSDTAASTSNPAQSSEKKEETLAPAAAQPAPTHTSASATQPVGPKHVLGHFLGAANACPGTSAQSHQTGGAEVDLQQLLSMFFGGAAPTSVQPQAGSSKSASASNTNQSAKTELQEREERELAEAIRLSLEESQPSTIESKGKAPAPAPVKDRASSTAEVHAIDASFTALSSEFVFPLQLDFSTSRTTSPTRRATAAEESVMARLSYSAQNQPVRFYHQALSGLLARLDAVDSFGDEGLRHGRKEVVGRVEGAMDEVERVVEAKWRRWAGRERVEAASAESAPSPRDASPAAAPEDTDAAAAARAGDDSTAQVVDSLQPVPASEDTTLLAPSATVDDAEPLATPSSPTPADVDAGSAPAPAAPSSLSAAVEPGTQEKQRRSDAGSDWSELDA